MNPDKAISNWENRIEILSECDTKWDYEQTKTGLWRDFSVAFKQALYKAHHTGSSGLKYKSDEEMRRLIGLSPKH